jgi:hypothetical protein
MKLPAIQGVIRRRMLINFRVEPEVVQRQLPAPFRPKLVGGAAMAGICLIRLEHVRPEWLSVPIGLSSENAAHRIAFWWEDERGQVQEGVYIPRRDTDSYWNHLAGGRLFPGTYERARFAVREENGTIEFSMQSADGEVTVRLCARPAPALPETSSFVSLAAASRFFEEGAVGYSATRRAGRVDGMRLCTRDWQVEPLAVESVFSSYFADETRFPRGAVAFDSALLMRNIPHQWQSVPAVSVDREVAAPSVPTRRQDAPQAGVPGQRPPGRGGAGRGRDAGRAAPAVLGGEGCR